MVSTEIIHKIYDGYGEGAYIQVDEDGDGLDCVRIQTPNKNSQDYFGKIYINLSPDMAEALANAILAKVKELRER
jgi:hypothetical protein